MNDIQIRPLRASEWSTFKDFRLAALKSAPGMFATSYEEASARSPESWREIIAGRCGLSSMLYQARLDWIRTRDKFKRAVAAMRASNEASQRACRHFGFTCIDRAPRTWPDGATDDELIYELRLKD